MAEWLTQVVSSCLQLQLEVGSCLQLQLPAVACSCSCLQLQLPAIAAACSCLQLAAAAAGCSCLQLPDGWMDGWINHGRILMSSCFFRRFFSDFAIVLLMWQFCDFFFVLQRFVSFLCVWCLLSRSVRFARILFDSKIWCLLYICLRSCDFFLLFTQVSTISKGSSMESTMTRASPSLRYAVPLPMTEELTALATSTMKISK